MNCAEDGGGNERWLFASGQLNVMSRACVSEITATLHVIILCGKMKESGP
jgi:hypothetical protein